MAQSPPVTAGPSPSDAQSSVESSESAKNSLGWKCFRAFVNGQDLSTTEEDLRKFAIEELNVNISDLPRIINENLPLIVVTYMNAWTGWLYKSDYHDGKFQEEHYYDRFKKHLVQQMKRLGSSAFIKQVMKPMIVNPDAKSRNIMKAKTASRKGGPLILKKNPEFAPYAISIQCPAHMLNTIVFNAIGDDVIMKQHLGSNWQDLSTAQLVNWPHVEVTFVSQDLCFVRRQATEYVRYLNFLPHECKRYNENIIESVERLNSNIGMHQVKNCYTIQFLEEYIKEYLIALKTIKDKFSYQITANKLEEIHTILQQFLEDVKLINVKKSMATNTIVLFRLCQVPFIRNKKLVKHSDVEGEDARVGYCEIITPKVELILLYFRAKQNFMAPIITFESTEKLKKTVVTSELLSLMPQILYKCTFCNAEFSTGQTKLQMMEHLKKEHKMEQHVRCTACKKQFDVLSLAACRWRHKCTESPTGVTVL